MFEVRQVGVRCRAGPRNGRTVSQGTFPAGLSRRWCSLTVSFDSLDTLTHFPLFFTIFFTSAALCVRRATSRLTRRLRRNMTALSSARRATASSLAPLASAVAPLAVSSTRNSQSTRRCSLILMRPREHQVDCAKFLYVARPSLNRHLNHLCA
jgi:hypothetical protein